MASDAVNYELERAAGVIKDWSSRTATPDQDVILDDVIEILHRAHDMPPTFDLDDLAKAIADWCLTAYGPPLYDFEVKPATTHPGSERAQDGDALQGPVLEIAETRS